MDVLDRLLVALSGLLIAAAIVGVVVNDWFLAVLALLLASQVTMYVRPVRRRIRQWIRQRRS